MKKTLCLCILLAVGASAKPVAPCARLPLFDYDVGLVDYKFLDTVFVGDTYTFNKVAVANYSVSLAIVWFEFRLPSGYPEGRTLVLPIGDTQTVFLPLMPTVFESAGVYPVICCTLEWSLDQDSTNDGGTKYVAVLPRPGVRAAEAADREPRRPVASYSTRVLRAGEPGATWYTTTGSRVRAAAARPGVYVVVRDGTVSRVVLVR